MKTNLFLAAALILAPLASEARRAVVQKPVVDPVNFGRTGGAQTGINSAKPVEVYATDSCGMGCAAQASSLLQGNVPVMRAINQLIEADFQAGESIGQTMSVLPQIFGKEMGEGNVNTASLTVSAVAGAKAMALNSRDQEWIEAVDVYAGELMSGTVSKEQQALVEKNCATL